MSSSYSIGIDVGATQVKSALVTPNGEILATELFDTSDADRAWAWRVKEYIASVEVSRGSANWIGIAAPGLAAHDHRSISWMQGRLSSIQGFDWTDYLRRDRLVPIINDAHAALLAEMWHGAAAGKRDAILLTLGTGVGGAIASDGRLLTGQIGRAGHMGHISLNPAGPNDIVNTPGSLEDAIGDHTVFRRSHGRFTTSEALVDAYRAGDAGAREVWLESVRALAAAIASLINVVDPQVVIIGGGIAAAGKALFEPLSGYLDRFEWRPHGIAVPVVAAELGEFAGAIGAARNAMLLERNETE